MSGFLCASRNHKGWRGSVSAAGGALVDAQLLHLRTGKAQRLFAGFGYFTSYHPGSAGPNTSKATWLDNFRLPLKRVFLPRLLCPFWRNTDNY